MPLKGYLAAIAIFCNEVKGKSMLALSRDLGTSYKTAFVLAHKLREAMAVELKGRTIGGEGKVAEVDGAHFGGYVKPATVKEHRADRRYAANRSSKRKAVVVIRERNGNSLPAVFRTEGAALSFIKARVMKGTVINADEAGAWNELHSRYEMKIALRGWRWRRSGRSISPAIGGDTLQLLNAGDFLSRRAIDR